MKHFGKKVEYQGVKFDSQKELDFYRHYLENSNQRVDIHPHFKLVETFKACGYRMRGIDYTPDFVTYDHDGNMTHVYDVKTSLSPLGVDSAAKLRFKLFTLNTNMPVEIVVPRANDFKMTMFGWTTNSMLDKHVHYDRHGNMKINKTNGQPVYDRYNVYRDINYNIHEIVGW